ncbi:MAG TPA: fumarylacetoacetate hydrolase family protein [Acidimicrobiia bacterium]|nr:fumarylacetoacetate hydrolase family protein [Acidimicrobiia bacterium]
MRLVRYAGEDGPRCGLVEDADIVDITAALPSPDDTVALIDLAMGAGLAPSALGGSRTPLSDATLLPPIQPRKNVFAVGKNFIEHVRELPGADTRTEPPPEYPIIFSKPPTALIGPGQEIDTGNDPTSTTDYEGELAVVIGRTGKGIRPEDAMAHVFGYTIVNDVTARALQRRHGQWLTGKGPDTFCPIGPWIVSSEEIPDVTRLTIRTSVNGELRQEGSLADLIFDIPTLIATLSSVMTLETGDVIATGTPPGVGIGFDPPRYLQPGDVVEITIDPIGTLTNPVV